MEENHRQKRTRLAGERAVQQMEARRMEAYYCATREEALQKALSLIPEDSSVGWGGSISVEEIGLKDAVRTGNYKAIDRDAAATPGERMHLMRQCLTADVFLMGTNAFSEDGQLVNIDGMGNRVAALCFGPKSVIVIAGMNKMAATLNDAVSRARHTAAPINAARFDGNTPCSLHGICADCKLPDCICNEVVITRGCRPAGRIKVILVGEDLGY